MSAPQAGTPALLPTDATFADALDEVLRLDRACAIADVDKLGAVRAKFAAAYAEALAIVARARAALATAERDLAAERAARTTTERK